MQLAGTTIRVACNQASRTDFVNALGSQAPLIPRAGSVRMPCAVFADDPSKAANLVTDLGNIVTANLVIRRTNAAGAVLIEKVVPAADFTPGLTFDQWQARTAAHFTFDLSPTDTNLSDGQLWIAIGVSTTNAGDISLVFCANAQLKDYGIFNAAQPTSPDYTSWSKAEADGRYAPAGSIGLVTSITSVGDNATGSLEAQPTAALPVPSLRTLYLGGELQNWVLETSTAATGPGVQRPNDFNVSTNPKVWTRK